MAKAFCFFSDRGQAEEANVYVEEGEEAHKCLRVLGYFIGIQNIMDTICSSLRRELVFDEKRETSCEIIS